MKNAFVTAFEKAKEVPYNPKWENGTGYLDGATEWFPTSDMGTTEDIYKAVDPQGRKILMIPIYWGGYHYGTHVIFERYVNEDTSVRSTYVSNAPDITKPITPDGALSDDDLLTMIGNIYVKDDNLNETVRSVLAAQRRVEHTHALAQDMADEWGIADHADPAVLDDFLIHCSNHIARTSGDPKTITLHHGGDESSTFALPLIPEPAMVKWISEATRITVG